MRLTTGWELLRDTYAAWSEDRVPRLGAALAFYSTFSLAPLLLIAIAIAGWVFGHDAAERQVIGTLDGLVGKDGAEAVHGMLERANRPAAGLWATLFGVGTLLLGASGVFGQLKDALNTIWGVAPRPGQPLLGTIRERFFSITMVLGTGFLLLVSLLVSAALSALTTWAGGLLPGFDALWQGLNQVVSFAVTATIFALTFKYVPDARVAWRDVWAGAVLTAVLFTAGRWALGVYLATSGLTSPFGAAGSLVVVLFWVYWSAQILFFGAEFTKVLAARRGAAIRPDADAVTLAERARIDQGLAARPGAARPHPQRTGRER